VTKTLKTASYQGPILTGLAASLDNLRRIAASENYYAGPRGGPAPSRITGGAGR